MKSAALPIDDSAYSAYTEARDAFRALAARSRTPLPENPEARLLALRRFRARLHDTLARMKTAWEAVVALEESLLRRLDRAPGTAPDPLHAEILNELSQLGADSRLGPRHAENLRILERTLGHLHAVLAAQRTRQRALERRPHLRPSSPEARPDPRMYLQPWQIVTPRSSAAKKRPLHYHAARSRQVAA